MDMKITIAQQPLPANNGNAVLLASPTVTVTGSQIVIVNILAVSPIAIEVTITSSTRWPPFAVTAQPDGTLEIQVADHSSATIGNLPFSFCHYESQNKDQLTVLLIADEAITKAEPLLLWCVETKTSSRSAPISF